MGIVWNILCPRKNIVRCKNMKGPKKAIELTWEEQARYIDQSVLKPEFSDEEIIKYIPVSYTHLLRKIWAEGTFAVLKREHKLNKIQKRGLQKAIEECLLSATALNLKRLAKAV